MKCNKCNEEVVPSNDIAHFEAALLNDPSALVVIGSRHLLPVKENGQVICEGSPSRAQYLEGQARDKRPEYSYRPETENEMRIAYNIMQAFVVALYAVNDKQIAL